MSENTPIISFKDADIMNGEATVIYGLDMELKFITKIRDEVKFASLDDLRTQLESDRDACLDVLSSQA